MINPQVTRLESGLQVVSIPMPASESVTVLALSNTGSRYETPEQYGIAHFFEHMVFKGTQSYPTAQDLAVSVDGIGANFNAYTSKEYTGYYVQSASRHFDLALDVVSDMLLTPQLRQEDIDREKGVIVEEINMYVDSPQRHINNLFEQLIYKGSGLEHDVLGSKETVTSLKTADFETFLHDWYDVSNLVVVVAGDAAVVSDSAFLENVGTAFSKAHAERRRQPDTTKHLAENPLSDQKLLINHRPTEQAHIVMGWPGLKRGHAQRYALTLLGTVMGGGMSSRLFSEVREKRGLCYYVYSDIDMYHDGGLVGAGAGVDPQRVDEAITVITDEWTEVVSGKKAITQDELERAKEHMAGKLALSLETSDGVAQYFGLKQLLEGEMPRIDEIIKRYNQVTLEEVQAVAEQLLQSGELRLGLIGPFENDEARFEALRARG